MPGLIRKRLSRKEPYGLYFTTGLLLAGLFFVFFLVIAREVINDGLVVEADIRIMNLIGSLRLTNVAQVFLFFTYLANWQIIISLGSVVIIALLLYQEKIRAIVFASAILFGEILLEIAKLITARPRPDVYFSLIPQEGYAFPSGHATLSVILYGLITYFLVKFFKKRKHKALIFLGGLMLVFFIGYSRIYLGVHWTSDVLAGWSLGMVGLLVSIAILRARSALLPPFRPTPYFYREVTGGLVFLLLLGEVLFIFYFYFSHPLGPDRLIHIPSPPVVDVSWDDLMSVSSRPDFPKFSETITGRPMSPVSLVVVGSENELIGLFSKAGWYIAETPRLNLMFRLARAALLDQSDPTAPVTPSFLDATPEIIAFQKPTEKETVRERHHTRFWKTNFQVSSTPVWVATASFDEGLKYIISHRIHPDIDAERDFIMSDLAYTGLVEKFEKIQIVPPLKGRNQIGDEFFTNGQAYVIKINFSNKL